nr:PUR family DNA/RNA-binding protein [Niabella hibiscisoli]
MEAIYSKRLRAGKRRTYFFDVRSTKGNDYYLTITESRKRFDDNGYDRHKVFLYKEDFNKFLKALNEAVDYVKTDLMPDFDFDAFNHDDYDEEGGNHSYVAPAAVAATPAPAVEPPSPVEEPANDEQVVENVEPKVSESGTSSTTHEEVDKW